MKKHIMITRSFLFLALLSCFLPITINGQEINDQNYRRYSGRNNNPVQTQWGAVNTNLLNITDIGFSDGYEAPAGAERPNPRTISNTLFDQGDLINDLMGLSDFCWVWGQFMDHDIGLTSDGPEYMPIQVPAGDPDFDPFALGQAIIPLHRNVFMPQSGTNVGNPRRYPNEITAFIDGSGVYGSDIDRATWLRTLEDGKLKTSAGNFLPFNTISGNFYDEIDPSTPFMANATEISEKIFVAGDVRASENSLLLSFHILFMREHNRQCDLLKAEHPDWTDEQLYQYARKIVGGIIQSIQYEEWLPAVGIDLPDYNGYDQSVNPQLSSVFTAAAYRVGHTLLSSTLQRLNANGNVIPEGNLALKDAFFNPFAILDLGRIDPYLKGMAVQIQQNMDAKVVGDIRNFLFGQPGLGGLDLAAINIGRGRERGLTDYNTIRENIGLNRLNFFQQINSNSTVFTRLQSLYGDINTIDPWVGMLAEMPIPGSIFGASIHTILRDQFMNLRDGDRFYYWNDPVLTTEEKQYIQNISLRDVIMYNTDIELMQDNVFGALPHAEICQNMTLNLSGLIQTEANEPVSDVTLNLVLANNLETFVTNSDGQYGFPEAPFCDIDLLIPDRNDNIINGVSTFDIVLIQKHILAVDLLDSPYKRIAADINKSGTITTIDLIRLRKAILGIDTEFEGNTSWRFVRADFEFPDGIDPLSVEFPEFVDFSSEHSIDLINLSFIAIKTGDVNNSADLLLSPPQDNFTIPRFDDVVPVLDLVQKKKAGLHIIYQEMALEAGEVYTITIQLQPDKELEGLQFELQFNGLEVLDVKTELGAEFYAKKSTTMRMSWNSSVAGQPFQQKTIHLQCRALKTGMLSQMLSQNMDFASEAYGAKGELFSVRLKETKTNDSFILGQNFPNPFTAQTSIPFYLPKQDIVTLTIVNVSGHTVFQNSIKYERGWCEWDINRSFLPLKGYYRYTLTTSMETNSGSMLLQ